MFANSSAQFRTHDNSSPVWKKTLLAPKTSKGPSAFQRNNVWFRLCYKIICIKACHCSGVWCEVYIWWHQRTKGLWLQRLTQNVQPDWSTKGNLLPGMWHSFAALLKFKNIKVILLGRRAIRVSCAWNPNQLGVLFIFFFISFLAFTQGHGPPARDFGLGCFLQSRIFNFFLTFVSKWQCWPERKRDGRPFFCVSLVTFSQAAWIIIWEWETWYYRHMPQGCSFEKRNGICFWSQTRLLFMRVSRVSDHDHMLPR